MDERIRHSTSTQPVGPGLWQAVDADPWFIVEGPFRRGRYELRLRARTLHSGPPSGMQVRFADSAHEFRDENAILLRPLPGAEEPDELRIAFELPCDTPALRFHPQATPGRFALAELAFRRQSDWTRVLRTGGALARQLARSPRGLASDVEKYFGKRLSRAHEAAGTGTTLTVPSFLPQTSPLNLRIQPSLPARLNVLIPALTREQLSGGPNTAVNLTYRLAEAGVPVRYISTDRPMETDTEVLWQHFQTLTGIRRKLANVELVSAHDRGQPLEIGDADLFLATAWWTVHLIRPALAQMRCGRFLYLIQDFEPALYAWSTTAALASETYGLDFQPIICGRLLADYLNEQKVGRFAEAEFRARALAFEPAVDATRFHFDASRHTAARRTLLFYARPSAPRNLFELGIVALKRAVERGAFPRDSWELWCMGEPLPPADLGDGVTVRCRPWAGYDEYARMLRGCDVGLSLMLSPHTSYPPLEMAACGATTVTNTFSVKTAGRLRRISENLVAVPPTVEGVTEGLLAAALRAGDLDARAHGSRLHVPSTWNEVFDPLLPRVLQMWNDCQNPSGKGSIQRRVSA